MNKFSLVVSWKLLMKKEVFYSIGIKKADFSVLMCITYTK